jgi:hypothetical protein
MFERNFEFLSIFLNKLNEDFLIVLERKFWVTETLPKVFSHSADWHYSSRGFYFWILSDSLLCFRACIIPANGKNSFN